MSELEDTLAFQLKALQLPSARREFKFHPRRQWRFDFAWPQLKVAAEVEGATWAGGRHTRGSGFEADCEKYNSAAEMGWRVLRFTAGMVKDGRAANTLERLLNRIAA